jgi:hypothetical protein
MIKINIIINNIMQDPMVIIGKIIINQIEITYITKKDIIRILDFNEIVSNVITIGKKVVLGMDVLYGRKLFEENKNSILKVGMNVVMGKKDQPVTDVCVTTRGWRVRILKADMPIEKLLEIEISPTKS